jgi:N-acetylglucosamine-6-phosphate deacetylase
MTTRLTGCILTPAGWVRGTLAFDGRIGTIDGDPVHAPRGDRRRGH